jgi:hypothetical protein
MTSNAQDAPVAPGTPPCFIIRQPHQENPAHAPRLPTPPLFRQKAEGVPPSGPLGVLLL